MTRNNILDFIFKAFNDNKMFESIMIESENEKEATSLLNEVARFIYCENHSNSNDNCSNCKDFNLNRIEDFIKIGDGATSISKEEIQKLISTFSTSSKKQGYPKIAIIKNAENLKKDAANSLLKFLEEPDENTYLFLITRNKNNVLPTIKSRTKLFSLGDNSVNDSDNYISKVIKSKNKDNILLMNNKMKKESKDELIVNLQNALNSFLNVEYMEIYELTLDLIEDVKFSNNANLAIDNFLIKVVKQLNESN